MDTVPLRDFLIGVPTCVETESLTQVWQVFQESGCLHVVIVNSERLPLGVLGLHRLIPYIFQEGTDQEGTDRGSRQQSICSLLAAADRTLLEPIVTLPAHWTLAQLQDSLPAYLPTVEQEDWVLVDEQGYVGLLDRLRLMQQFAVAASVQPIDPSATLLDPLIDLLERLPIPLMLQTSTGRIVAQNWVWRRQVGELENPGQIRQEAALILETMASVESYAAVSSRYPWADAALAQRQGDRPDLPGFYTGSWDHTGGLLEGSRYSGACRLSAEPNACVCTCSMKDGQDRVWQFAKISMGMMPREPDVEPLPSSVLTASLPFKLATLNSHPDPSWRSLMQTESLWLVLAQDMTEQHQVAKELSAKNADLVQLNRLKDEFLACISHELKTPLTAVLGLSSLLKDKLLGELNERQSRYAHLIHQSGRQLILIVNDILDLTRIETGQLDLSLEPIQISKICQRAYEQARQLQDLEANSKTQVPDSKAEIQFCLEIEPGLESLIADDLRLRQMLTNLLSNAIKFTETGDKIGLRVEAWEDWVAFTVWDTGIGIPTDKQHLIFQKFQQLENPLTRRFDGTGLGLVLTQRLARLHGGDVTFTSIEGQGSQFTLLLPPCPPQAIGIHPQPLPTVQGSIDRHLIPVSHSAPITSTNRLVLIVEAAPQAIDNLTHPLTELGYRVAIARSGTEALEKVRRLQPCAIFLNPMLPMLSGWDVLTLLKTDEATQKIPVVITAMRLEKKRAQQNGANGFLSLPIQSLALEQTLAQIVSQQLPEPEPLEKLTVLYLKGHAAGADSTPDLNRLLHPHPCRVLEVDDLEQADLLARVWHPDVMLIDGMLVDPLTLMEQLSQSPFLAALPLVTLTAEMTQIANQASGLTVFPCFISAPVDEPNHYSSALLQVIQMAAGVHWKPHVLIADWATLERNWTNRGRSRPVPSDRTKASGSLQAVGQYIQTAGFQSSVGNTWEEVLRQLQHQSVDLLLFHIQQSKPHPLMMQIAEDLQQLAIRPPVWVWHHTQATEFNEAEAHEFSTLWGAIATQVLPPGLSMSELLAEMNQRFVRKS